MKKLIVLLVVALSVPTMAAYIGAGNPLAVNLQGGGLANAIPGYQGWLFASTWTGPVHTTFVNPLAEQPWEIPTGDFDGMQPLATGPSDQGLSRQRDGGFAGIAGTGWYGTTQQGWGVSYDKVTIKYLEPGVTYKISLWSYEADGVWSSGTDSPAKFVQWSTQDPRQWCIDNGYGPGGANAVAPQGGYGNPQSGKNTSDMPAGLAALCQASARINMHATDAYAHEGWSTNKGVLYATAQGDDGIITLYGWMDGVHIWGGSDHVPLEGFYIVPEPTTIALLGLGALALIRRKRA